MALDSVSWYMLFLFSPKDSNIFFSSCILHLTPYVESGMAYQFKTSMVTLNMFQINGTLNMFPTNTRGHILDLVFVLGQLQGDLALEDITVS